MYLALDTAGPRASLALGNGDGAVVAESTAGIGVRNSEALLPAIAALCASASVPPAGLRAVVLGAGPGSYTGLRIAAAAAKGIVHALGLALYTHGSLEAMSLGADQVDRPLLPLLDARRGEMFVACHGRDGDDLVELLAPALLSLEEAAALAHEHGALAIGSGAGAGSARLRRAGVAVDAAAGDRAAVGLLRLQARRAEAARVDDPGAWEPVYLRREERHERGQPTA